MIHPILGRRPDKVPRLRLAESPTVTHADGNPVSHVLQAMMPPTLRTEIATLRTAAMGMSPSMIKIANRCRHVTGRKYACRVAGTNISSKRGGRESAITHVEDLPLFAGRKDAPPGTARVGGHLMNNPGRNRTESWDFARPVGEPHQRLERDYYLHLDTHMTLVAPHQKIVEDIGATLTNTTPLPLATHSPRDRINPLKSSQRPIRGEHRGQPAHPVRLRRQRDVPRLRGLLASPLNTVGINFRDPTMNRRTEGLVRGATATVVEHRTNHLADLAVREIHRQMINGFQSPQIQDARTERDHGTGHTTHTSLCQGQLLASFNRGDLRRKRQLIAGELGIVSLRAIGLILALQSSCLFPLIRFSRPTVRLDGPTPGKLSPYQQPYRLPLRNYPGNFTVDIQASTWRHIRDATSVDLRQLQQIDVIYSHLAIGLSVADKNARRRHIFEVQDTNHDTPPDETRHRRQGTPQKTR